MTELCYCDDYEPATVFRSTDVLAARKVHRCSECLNAILPGESYRHVFGVWPTIDGPQTHHICARCMVLEEWVKAHVPCYCSVLGELHQRVKDEMDNNDEMHFLRPEFDALMADIEAQPACPE